MKPKASRVAVSFFIASGTIKTSIEDISWQIRLISYTSCLPLNMAIPVVEFSREGYKIRQVFGKKSTVVKCL